MYFDLNKIKLKFVKFKIIKIIKLIKSIMQKKEIIMAKKLIKKNQTNLDRTSFNNINQFYTPISESPIYKPLSIREVMKKLGRNRFGASNHIAWFENETKYKGQFPNGTAPGTHNIIDDRSFHSDLWYEGVIPEYDDDFGVMLYYHPSTGAIEDYPEWDQPKD